MKAITLDLSRVIKLTSEQYYKLATAHPDLRMERTPTGELGRVCELDILVKEC